MNILYFSTIIRNEGYEKCDPKYIEEKWERYIGVPFENIDLPTQRMKKLYSELFEYFNIWGITIYENPHLFRILMFLKVYYSNIEDLVYFFKTYINDMNVNDVEDKSGIHPLLLDKIEEYCERDYNKSYLTKLKRDRDIERILSK